MNDLLSATYYGNFVWEWALALLLAGLTLFALYVIKTVVFRRLSAMTNGAKAKMNDVAVSLLGKTHVLFLIVLALFVGSSVLFISPGLQSILAKASVVGLVLQGAVWGSGVIEFLVRHYAESQDEAGISTSVTSGTLSFFGRIIIWASAVLVALSNVGVNVTALVAGLGVGSVAVALAVQSILADLFAAVSIVLDKPFAIGDLITIDTYWGTVEHIGLKSTRLRSINGELMVFSNSDLLKSRIRNYKRMHERRVIFTIGVTYGTPYEKLVQIPVMIREVVEEQENTRFERAHFKTYGDFSLNFEIVYYVQDPDYNLFMDIQQAINLAIFRRFEEDGIEFAFPTQTIFLAKPN